MTNRTIQTSQNKSRSDKFKLIMDVPNIFKKLESNNTREKDLMNLNSIQFSLYDAIIPEITVPEVPMQIDGQNFNISSYSRPAYPPVVCNFEVDNEYNNYWILNKWLTLYNDPTTGLYADKRLFPDGKPKMIPELDYEYQTDIKLIALDEYNNDKMKFTFKYAFITRLGQLNYNYRDSGQLTCNFSFVFNQLLPELI